MKCLSLAFRLCPVRRNNPRGDEDPGEDEGCACYRARGERFPEEGRGFRKGEEWDEVDKVIRLRRADGPDDPVPRDVRERRGKAGEEGEVEQKLRVEKRPEIEAGGKRDEHRRRSDERPEENLSRHVVGRVFRLEVPHDYRVDRP